MSELHWIGCVRLTVVGLALSLALAGCVTGSSPAPAPAASEVTAPAPLAEAATETPNVRAAPPGPSDGPPPAAPPASPAALEADAAAALEPEPPAATTPKSDRRSRLIAHVVALLGQRTERLDAEQRQGVARAVADAHLQYDLDPLLVLAVIAQESRFDPRARGPRGSLGLMQVRPFVAEHWAEASGVTWRGAATLFDAEANVRIGVRYLAEMLARFGDQDLALAAYNMGPSRLSRRLRQGIQPRARYSGRVARHYQDLLALTEALPGCDPQLQSC